MGIKEWLRGVSRMRRQGQMSVLLYSCTPETPSVRIKKGLRGVGRMRRQGQKSVLLYSCTPETPSVRIKKGLRSVSRMRRQGQMSVLLYSCILIRKSLPIPCSRPSRFCKSLRIPPPAILVFPKNQRLSRCSKLIAIKLCAISEMHAKVRRESVAGYATDEDGGKGIEDTCKVYCIG